MESVAFEIPLKPTPASRPRVTKRGATYYPKAHEQYKQALKAALMELPAFRTFDLVLVKMLFVMPRYKTSDYPTHRADLDNLAKLPMDTMTKSLDDPTDEATFRYWQDDSLVVSLQTAKRFVGSGEEPHTKVQVFGLEEDEIEDTIHNWWWSEPNE